MTDPIIANNKPEAVELKKGDDYYFCACGKSSKQPFCDGSHKGMSLSPIKFQAKEDGTAYLCACKHSKNLPYCDGSHKQFSTEQVGKEG